MAGARSTAIRLIAQHMESGVRMEGPGPHSLRKAEDAWLAIEEHFALSPEVKDMPGDWAIEKMGFLGIIKRQSAKISELTSQGEDQ